MQYHIQRNEKESTITLIKKDCVSLDVICINTSDDKQLRSNDYQLGTRGEAVG
jgi:hypothetical protein